MLSLSSHRWSELEHAYGSSTNIPQLLRQLEKSAPGDDWQDEPHYSLWSSLCHQGDIYTASYAAAAHLIDFCLRKPERTHGSVLHLAVRIELARLEGRGPVMPRDLAAPYQIAVEQMPLAAINMLKNQRNEHLTTIAAAALAVANEQPSLAEAFMELEGDTVAAFLKWVHEH